MKPDRRSPEDPGFEQYQDDISWSIGVGKPAGIFWLAGHVRMATHDSAAEERLLRQGAVLVGTLRFDADPIESVHRTGHVELMDAARVRREFPRPGSN